MNVLPLSISATFCDSVRQEIGGFKSIIGVYARRFNVRSFPHQFPKLSVYVRGTYAKYDPVSTLTIRVMNGSTTIIDHPAPDEFFRRPWKNDDENSRTFETTIVMVGEEVEKPCTLTVIAVVNGTEYLAGDLTIALFDKAALPASDKSSGAAAL